MPSGLASRRVAPMRGECVPARAGMPPMAEAGPGQRAVCIRLAEDAPRAVAA